MTQCIFSATKKQPPKEKDMKKTRTVYEHIRTNNIKTWLLIALFPVIFIILTFLFTRLVAPLDQTIKTTTYVAIPTFIACGVWMLIS